MCPTPLDLKITSPASGAPLVLFPLGEETVILRACEFNVSGVNLMMQIGWAYRVCVTGALLRRALLFAPAPCRPRACLPSACWRGPLYATQASHRSRL